MLLSQLQTQLQSLGYGTDTLTQQTAALNDAYRQLCGHRRWSWLEGVAVLPTVAGQRWVDLSTDVPELVAVDAVRLSLGDAPFDLEPAEVQLVRHRQLADDSSGPPEIWTTHQRRLELWPTPDQVYSLTIDFIKDPPDLSSSTDEPIFPEVYHDILVWGAVKNAAFRQRDWNSHTIASTEYANRLRDMKQDDGIRQRQLSSQIAQSGFYY